MGAIYDLYKLLNEDDVNPAMEADDITKDVIDQANNIAGDDNGVEMPDNKGKDIDTNTDDILGTKTTNEDNNTDTNTDNKNNDEVDDVVNQAKDVGNGDENTDDEYNDDDIENEDGMDDNTGEQNQEDQQEKKLKAMLHKNFNYLYEIIDSNISILSDYSPNIMDENVIKTLAIAKERLEECKQVISNVLKEDYDTASYARLMKQYVGINRVYDLVIEMIRRVSEDAAKQMENSKDKKKKNQ